MAVERSLTDPKDASLSWSDDTEKRSSCDGALPLELAGVRIATSNNGFRHEKSSVDNFWLPSAASSVPSDPRASGVALRGGAFSSVTTEKSRAILDASDIAPRPRGGEYEVLLTDCPLSAAVYSSSSSSVCFRLSRSLPRNPKLILLAALARIEILQRSYALALRHHRSANPCLSSTTMGQASQLVPNPKFPTRSTSLRLICTQFCARSRAPPAETN